MMDAPAQIPSSDLARVVLPSAEDREMTRLKKAARDFESLVLESLLKEMKNSVPGAETSSDPASGTIDDFGATALSGVMANSGGFGLAEVLVDAMEAHVRALATKNEGGGRSP